MENEKMNVTEETKLEDAAGGIVQLKITRNADGTEIVTFPDGTRHIKYPDGTVAVESKQY